MYRKVKIHYGQRHGIQPGHSWVGRFHGWAVTSQDPQAIVEDNAGVVHLIDYTCLDFIERPDEEHVHSPD